MGLGIGHFDLEFSGLSEGIIVTELTNKQINKEHS